MNSKIKSVLCDGLSIAIIILTVTLMLSWIYCWDIIDMEAPFYYYGNDEMTGIVNAKLFEQGLSVMETDRLGAPYSAEFYDFQASLMHNFDLLTLKLCVMISGNAVTGYNWNIYLTFYLLAIISFLVMRELKVSRLIGVLGSIAFAFSPYVSGRLVGHTQLAQAYFIPLSILLCIWLYERDDVFCFNWQFFKNPRNYFAILFIILIGNNGIAYYPFFTCYLLMVTAVAKLLKEKRILPALKCVAAVIGMVGVIGVNLLPYIRYVSENGTIEAAARQPIVQAETYGMKIVQLFVPLSSNGNNYIQGLMNDYNSNAPLVNENVTSFLGIIAIVGFILLLIYMLVKAENDGLKRMRFLGQLNIFLVFLAAGNGIGTMFAYFVSPMIRGYNRASIVIAYVSILGLCIFANELVKKYNKYIAYPIVAAVMALGIYCQAMPNTSQLYNVGKYYSDKEFFESVENSVEKESMIFNLPYHIYPEGGYDDDMPQDALFAGMVHTNTLKFSYGGVVGRKSDLHNRETASLPYAEMVARLKADKFAGICIDRRAYSEEEIKELENQLLQLTDGNIIISKNEDLSFFKLK